MDVKGNILWQCSNFTVYSSTAYIGIASFYKVFHHFQFLFAAYWTSVNMNRQLCLETKNGMI